ncbi:hypothetical protein QCA50_012271 [Cerrena zonata]|uniref:Enoyl reductase (ER) domain-containing protein n=1 Tax=Cerrena zonata TaxID=2478898 RepID=A0AAW0FUF8_9APHY
MSFNEGAVITGSRNTLNLVAIRQIPYPKLEDDMIIIKAVAYAVNPTDWKHVYPEDFIGHQLSETFKYAGLGIHSLACVFGSMGSYLGKSLARPLTFYQRGNVAGSDVSGIVEEVGKNVDTFKKGDIVNASLHGGINKVGGFSKYVMVSPNATVKYPVGQLSDKPLDIGEHPCGPITSFESAAAVGVGLKTIALSFYYNLGIPVDKLKNSNDYLLIWGGATATGILGIQIAKSVFGIKVITTASKKNHSLLSSLGADEIFDYNDDDVIEKLKIAGGGNIKYALDCVSNLKTLQSIYDATEGSSDVTIDNLLFLNERSITTDPKRKVKFTSTDAYLVDGRKHFGHVASPKMLEEYLEFWTKYLPSIIKNIKAPPLKVLPTGLQSANEGLKMFIEGNVAGQKLVFRNNSE